MVMEDAAQMTKEEIIQEIGEFFDMLHQQMDDPLGKQWQQMKLRFPTEYSRYNDLCREYVKRLES
jgi:hypothetical protein